MVRRGRVGGESLGRNKNEMQGVSPGSTIEIVVLYFFWDERSGICAQLTLAVDGRGRCKRLKNTSLLETQLGSWNAFFVL